MSKRVSDESSRRSNLDTFDIQQSAHRLGGAPGKSPPTANIAATRSAGTWR
ncbi:MAG: hypothetical protein AAGC55_34640 [Myxococcota bacterium]